MSLTPWHEEPISKKHDRKSFDCGEAALNDFLLRQRINRSDGVSTESAADCLS